MGPCGHFVSDRKPDEAREFAAPVVVRQRKAPGVPHREIQIVVPVVAVVLLLAAWLPIGPAAPSVALASGTLTAESHGTPLFSLPRPSTVPLTWTELLPEGVPPSNLTTSPVLVYDPLTQQTLDFASTFDTGLTSVWSFDGGVWTNVTPSGNFTHQDLTEFSATFDAAGGYLLLFGYVGYHDENPDEAETWTYSAGTWSELNLSTEPQGTSMAGVTYDPADSSAILLTTLFGNASSLTWAFQGGNWTQLVTSTSPPALFGSTMAFDNSTADQELVLFADGVQEGGPTRGFWNQTWVYRGDQWLNVTATSGPAPTAGEGALTYDASEQAVVLADSGFFANTTPARTWEFTDGKWVDLSTPTIAPWLGIGGNNFAYDPNDGYAVFVGTYASAYTGNLTTQTWKLDRTALGPPPTAALNVTPLNLTEGGTVHITASGTGGFGALAFLLRVDIPGCSETERETGSWDCTTHGSGEGLVGFEVTDQAGRSVFVQAFVRVASLPSSSTDWFVYIAVVGVVVAAVAVAVAVVIWRRRRAPPPTNPPSSGRGSGGPSP